MSDDRKSPGEFLELIKKEEQEAQKGKLKIFFGAAPGVGKTYSMLANARERQKEGLDVVIGIVETHGRFDTQAMLEGFEILPRIKINYRDKIVDEFDIDGALARHPALIIIDEMAHTNIAGHRHSKRWQDIKELIDRGIDVYTTLNVQHVESLNDVIAQITRIKVAETVPDSIIDQADIIELVDLSPTDLIKRLEGGKIYIPEQIRPAKNNFFKQSNLVALRELALRYTAELIDTEVNLHRVSQSSQENWLVKEYLLVCIGPDDQSAKLIRSARRLAVKLQAEWTVIFIDSPRIHVTDEQRDLVHKHFALAERLGANTVILYGNDIVKEVLNYAFTYNVSKIVISKRIRPRWKDLVFGSLVDELVRHSKEIDIYIIYNGSKQTKKSFLIKAKHKNSIIDYLKAFLCIGITTAINYLLFPYISDNILLLYLLALVIISMRGRRAPAIWSTILSILCYNYFFVPPVLTFLVKDPIYFISFLVMFIVGEVVCYLTLLEQKQAEKARQQSYYLTELLALNNKLSKHIGFNQALEIGVTHMASLLESTVCAIVPNTNGDFEIVAASEELKNTSLNKKQLEVITWVYELLQPAGLGTETLVDNDALYMPLLDTNSQKAIGVLQIQPTQKGQLFSSEKLHISQACSERVAFAVAIAQLLQKKCD